MEKYKEDKIFRFVVINMSSRQPICLVFRGGDPFGKQFYLFL